MPTPHSTRQLTADPPPSDKRGFSIAEFGEAYGPGRTLTYELIKSGRLRAYKLGAKTLILKEDAEHWLASLPVLQSGSVGRPTSPEGSR